MDLQVFIFTWNTQTVRYNNDADFVSVLGNEIVNSDRNYDLVVIGLQEDAIRDSPLLNDGTSLIANALSGKYELLELVSLSGWGVTTYKALKDEWEYRPRGLRLAVFKRHGLNLDITHIDTTEMVCPSIRDWITAGKGGVAINLYTSVGKLTFLNMHLPFDSNSLLGDRHSAVMWQATCMRALYENTISLFDPDYLFLMGDLNFRVQIRSESGAAEIVKRLFDEPGYMTELYAEADELKLLMDYAETVPVLNEGIDNCGPLFLPTCKLRQGREDSGVDSYRTGQQDQRTPSWCDRILFKELGDGEINCTAYDSWDYGAMNLSDHASVIGVYNIKTEFL